MNNEIKELIEVYWVTFKEVSEEAETSYEVSGDLSAYKKYLSEKSASLRLLTDWLITYDLDTSLVLNAQHSSSMNLPCPLPCPNLP
jgi:hypothetical protein